MSNIFRQFWRKIRKKGNFSLFHNGKWGKKGILGRVTGAEVPPFRPAWSRRIVGTGAPTWNHTPQIKSFTRFFSKNRGVEGQSPHRFPQKAKSPIHKKAQEPRKAPINRPGLAGHPTGQPHSLANNPVNCWPRRSLSGYPFQDSLQRQTPPVSGGSLSYSVSSPCSFSSRSNSVDATATNRAQGRDA